MLSRIVGLVIAVSICWLGFKLNFEESLLIGLCAFAGSTLAEIGMRRLQKHKIGSNDGVD